MKKWRSLAVVMCLIGLEMALYTWMMCAKLIPRLSFFFCTIMLVLFTIIMYVGVKFSIKANKPYYLISAAVILLIGVLIMVSREAIEEIYESILNPWVPPPGEIF